jgi:uncharacterized protein with von Willebrand factor type A (vWA) domain
MIQTKHVIRSLPLLADILGRKYGIKVQIGGGKASTNGNVIQLPALPVDADDKLLPMIRGYIDHEAAHLRHTDFKFFKGLTPLEHSLCNAIEDWRVEKALADYYPGCGQNFQWLLKELFLGKVEKESEKITDPSLHVLNWLLITVRSWSLPELQQEKEFLHVLVENFFPGLGNELEPVIQSIPTHCKNTKNALHVTRQIIAVIRKHIDCLERNDHPQNNEYTQHSEDCQDVPAKDSNADARKQNDIFREAENIGDSSMNSVGKNEDAKNLSKLLSASRDELPDDLGAVLRNAVTDACNQNTEKLTVAVEGPKHTSPLSQEELVSVRQATTALRTRLQGFLQSVRSVRNHNGYVGKMDVRKLHSLTTGDAKVFVRRGERVGMNTAVHILLDASGSMSGNRILLAGQACFATASALHEIRGISVGVTAFPSSLDNATVTPVLRHNQKMHNRFNMNADGCTPLGSSLWWIMQQLENMPEKRKIVLVITDGVPDYWDEARTAIKSMQNFGMEVYGIGIMIDAAQSLFPYRHCQIIKNINGLAPAMFRILQDALLSRKQVNTRENI